MNNMRSEEKLIAGMLIGLFIAGICIYINPEMFFMIHDYVMNLMIF
jgi:hypothetical protein